jgi:lipoate-protein ligase A
VPPTLELLVQAGLSPGESLAIDRALIDGRRAALRVYTLAGDVLALGRFHAAPAARPASDVRVMRRWSGGRAMPWGDGFVGVSLVLPHRSALVGDDPEALSPPQVPNRCVRGILAACESASVPAIYPGLDVLTVDRRLLGFVSFIVEEGGALVFEALLANGADAGVLPRLLDRADPDGVVPATMLTGADVTSLAARIGRPLALDDLATRIARGYAERLGVRCATGVAPTPAAFDETAWLAQRLPRPDFDRSAAISGQLGTVDIRFACDGGSVRDIAVGGDVIASAATIARLEAGLRGCPLARERLKAAVVAVLREPGAFLLGIGTPTATADAIARAIAG